MSRTTSDGQARRFWKSTAPTRTRWPRTFFAQHWMLDSSASSPTPMTGRACRAARRPCRRACFPAELRPLSRAEGARAGRGNSRLGGSAESEQFVEGADGDPGGDGGVRSVEELVQHLLGIGEGAFE